MDHGPQLGVAGSMVIDAGDRSKWRSRPETVYLTTERLKELFVVSVKHFSSTTPMNACELDNNHQFVRIVTFVKSLQIQCLRARLFAAQQRYFWSLLRLSPPAHSLFAFSVQAAPIRSRRQISIGAGRKSRWASVVS